VRTLRRFVVVYRLRLRGRAQLPRVRRIGRGRMSAPEEPRRRLTPTERLHEITLAALHRTPVKASEEVEITRNAKGDYQFRVAGVAGEGEDLKKVALRVQSIAADLDNDLPLSRAQNFGRDYTPPEQGKK
jgi:hypothetical protein